VDAGDRRGDPLVREAMAETLASGDHVEVVKLIGYSEGGRS